MIIQPAHTFKKNNQVCVHARVEWARQPFACPAELSFTIPVEFASYVPRDMDAFLTALIPVAMYVGEDIHIHGSISATLLYGIREYQNTLHFWKPEWFTRVRVTSDTVLQQDQRQRPPGVMGSFSGGVDSMYTLRCHLPDVEPLAHAQFTHALFIESNTTTVANLETVATKVRTYQTLLDSVDLTFVPARTNAMDFYYFNNDYALAMTYTNILIATAQMLQTEIGTFYFSADDTHDFPMVSIIPHTTVPLLSTNALRAEVFGASVTKMQKLETLSQWQPSYNHLTVCWEHPNGLQNCGQCVKCCHTTAGLDMLGMLQTYSTFPDRLYHHQVRTRVQSPKYFHFSKEWARFARAYGRWDLVFDFTYVLWRNRFIYYVLRPLGAPVRAFYRRSAKWKQYSPHYARFIFWLKKT